MCSAMPRSEALAAQAPNMTPTEVEVAFRGLLTKVAHEQLGDQVRVPGEGRVKAHTWRVTKLYKAKRQAGLHLKRARSYGTPQAVAACTQSYKQASASFNKVKDAEVRKVFKKSMDEEAEKGLPELSKKAHQAFKGLTGSKEQA